MDLLWNSPIWHLHLCPKGIMYVRQDMRQYLENLGLGCCQDILSKKYPQSQSNSRGDRDITVLTPAATEVWYLKRHLQVRAQEYWPLLIGGQSRAGREAGNYLVLERLGIGCAEVIAWGESRWHGMPTASFIITRKLVGQRLEMYWQECQEFQVRRRLMAMLAQTIKTLEKAGFYYLDWKAKHIYVHDQRLFLLDVERMGRLPWFSTIHQMAIYAIANLNHSLPSSSLSQSEKIKFVQNYLGLDAINLGMRNFLAQILRRNRHLMPDQRIHLRWWRQLRKYLMVR